MVDPKADKYRASSPYGYTINNPILFVDPYGNDFIIHYGNGGAFYTNSIATNSKYQIAVKEYKGENVSYDPIENTINWNPNIALIREKDVVCPQHLYLNMNLLMQNHIMMTLEPINKVPVHEYKNLEEYRVTTGPEQTVARANGELKKKSVTRRYYY